MRWILEEPGYEVEDRREEVLQECPRAISSSEHLLRLLLLSQTA